MKIDYTLPEWVFLDAQSHQGNLLDGRSVILHVRSASIIEMICLSDTEFKISEDVLSFEFDYPGIGGVERYVALLHYSATFDSGKDSSMILGDIIKPCVEWFIQCMHWEDKNILNESKADLN